MNGLYNGLDNGLHNGNVDGLFNTDFAFHSLRTLNFNNPLTNGLQRFFQLNEGSPKNLASEKVFDISTSKVNSEWIAGPSTATNHYLVSDKFSGLTSNYTNASDYIQTNYIPSSDKNQSIAFWFKSSTSIAQIITGNSNILTGLNGIDIRITIVSNTITFIRRAGVNNGVRDLTVTITIPSGRWNHVVAAYNNISGSTLYLNGVKIGANTVTGLTNTLGYCIGRSGQGILNYVGQIAHWGFWNRELNSTEVNRLYLQPYIIFN